jgi:predicted phosphodiesterase
MDHLTIFGDIHANKHALEAVWADMARRGLGNRYCLGDLVGYGAFPNEVTAVIRDRQIPTIMGNYDQGVGHSSDDCGCAYTNPVAEALGKQSIAWTNAHTSDDNKAFLRQLVKEIPLQLGDLRLLLVHGSPRRVNEYLFAERPASSLERIMDGIDADVLVCGHTHLPYHRILPSGRQVINAGSVGKPKDGDPRAGYVVLRANGRDLTVDFMRLAYDVAGAAQAVEAAEGLPNTYADMLRQGTG